MCSSSSRTVLERSGYDVTVFSELAGEPHAATIDKAVMLLRRLDDPFVVGLGGGSALDARLISEGDALELARRMLAQ